MESQEAGAKAGQEARVHPWKETEHTQGFRWERYKRRGPRVCLPWISSPVDEIWLKHKLADPISSRQLCLELGNTLQAEALSQLCLFLPRAWVCL